MRGMTSRIRATAGAFGCVAAALILLSATATQTAAQSRGEVEALRERIATLEREVQALRRDGGNGARRTGGEDLPPTLAARLEVRLTALERSIQTLTGRVEDIEHKINQAERRHETLRNDMIFRMDQLEKGRGGGGGGAGPRPGSGNAAPPREETRRDEARRDEPRREEPRRASLPEGSRGEQYAFAIDLLRKADYSGAQEALTEFIEKYPDDVLAGGAYYWLGRSYYVQRNYADAAVAFADGFRKFQDHPRAPASLLMLAKSLGQADKKREACAALAELRKRYPAAATQVRNDASDEGRRLGC